MKSLIEESSSIAKAIEKAWERANKPTTFSIKIFELPEKNFIGMIKKYAKIALFFDEIKEIKDIHHSNNIYDDSKKSTKPHQVKKNQSSSHKKQVLGSTTEQTKQSNFQHSENHQSVFDGKDVLPTWTTPMKDHLRAWLKGILQLIGFANVEFSFTEEQNVLKVNFDTPLIGNELKESILYKNISYLGMVSLRTHFKNEMKHLKVFLGRE